jgi:hypothetical protein
MHSREKQSKRKNDSKRKHNKLSELTRKEMADKQDLLEEEGNDSETTRGN